MKNLMIEATKSSPSINFDADSCNLSIEGASYPENTSNFFIDVVDWVADLLADTNRKVTLNIKLSYFNTSTSKALLDIIDMMEEKHKNGGNVELNWYYREDHENIQESGEEFAEDITFPFNLISYQKE